ncbi:MAG: adenylate/guanylate cyclase domain-containing protein, partial [Acidimicrobiales bacterium]
MIRSLYQRLGRRYVSTVLVLIFLNFYLVYLLGLGILTIYLDMSGAEFMRLVLVMVVVESGYTVSMPLLLRRRLGPVSRWLDGARDPEATLAAWRAAATVPLDWLRDLHRHWLPLPGFVAFAAYAVWELDLPVWNILILLPAIGVVTLYGIAVVYFILEQAMRPLLEDLARQSPAATQPEATGLSLRTRLLVTLSAISISTGVIV